MIKKFLKKSSISNINSHRRRVTEWLRSDERFAFFITAIQFINYEEVEGDILEFGVATGRSLALLALLHRENVIGHGYDAPTCTTRRIVGFDSFEGLPHGREHHPRFVKASFAMNNYHNHPFLGYGQQITPDDVKGIFSACDLPEPQLEVGLFEEVAPRVIPHKYSKTAMVHIDSDLYSSAKTALWNVAPILQEGTLVLFDNWFIYKGNPNRGESRAFREFLDEHPEWEAIHYQKYSVFCNSFIMHKRLL